MTLRHDLALRIEELPTARLLLGSRVGEIQLLNHSLGWPLLAWSRLGPLIFIAVMGAGISRSGIYWNYKNFSVPCTKCAGFVSPEPIFLSNPNPLE